ncbi:eukaryotic translation initiation factor 4 gamma 1-like isoform X1 [Xenia sp. Carnegie-2017]|uniref:eukaryotic translation initiation factor 4 gamma 1-like isoform X1 n=1 Tax=Xenia sp. Carnegie-2017 TaxID=2897299 RepID=UPI001F03EC09|nr:eukaryotic translation initiation factor 4 gamma 1-like isoform X1 [Xenia sp. Carnegie-2017]
MAEMTQEDYPSQVIDTSFLEKQEIVTPSDNDVIVFSNFSEMTVSHDNLLQMEREMEKEDLQERLFILQGQKDKIEKDPKKAFLQLEEERLNNDGKISLSNDQGICCRSMSTPFKSSTNSVTETSGNLENTPGSTESPDCSAADKEPSAMNCDKSNGTIVRDMEKTSKQKDDLPKPTAVVKEIKSNADGKKSEMKSETYSKTKTKSEPAKEDKVESSEETVLKSDNQQADKTPALKKSHSQADKPNQKQSNQRSQGKQSQPQATKPAEQPKKKSSRQRFKDINKKDTGGDLMDAYTEKKPSPEVHEGFIQNIAQPYPLPVSTASLQPKNISQTQPPLYNGMPPMYYSHMQSNQPIQPQQTQQQPAPNTGISTNTKKARSKRPSKIIIKDPNSKKDITEEIRTHSGTANGRSTATPPLANTAAQTESSAIQAEFAAKVEARRAGGKLYGEKSEGTNKEKPSQGEKSRIDLKIIENGKTPRDQEVKDCPMQIEKNSAKNAKLKNANVVDNSKKEDEMDFEAQQSSSNMKEKTKEETSYETEVKVLKADREQNGNIESDVEISYRRKEPDDVEKKILTKSDHLDFVTQKNGTELKSDLDSKQMTENNKESPNNSVATSDNIVSTSDNIVAASDNIFATSDHNPETRAKASFDKNQTPDPSAVTHYKNLIPPDDSEATPDIKPDTADNCAGTPENSTATLPQSRTGSSGGGSQRSEFLPSYARPKNQPGGGKRDSRSKPPRKIIPMAPHPVVVLNKSENRWLRPKEREKGLSEEEKTTAELYRNVMAILNKLTPQKFKTLVEKMMALNIDSCERLEGVIDIIFEKAIGEPVFSVAYANMCRCLFTLKINDADGNVVSFRKLLLNRCQKEFEKEKEDEALLEKQKLEQLEGLSEEEQKAKREELDEDLAKNKRRMLGNIKFIGELFKLKLLTENIMHDCIFKLLRAGDEESLESMCKLLFTIGKHLDSEKAKPRIVQYFDKINKIIIAKKVSWRVIFILRDVVDLRDNKWVPRREEHVNPKTIDQIHKEAEMEKQQEQKLVSQLPAKDKQQIKKGSSGGRDSPKPVANDGWITTGKGGKSQPIDQNKLRNMAKPIVDNIIIVDVEDLTWEDKEKTIGENIKVESEIENVAESGLLVERKRRKYERDFLLQCRHMQVCKEKPANLPHIDVILDVPQPPRILKFRPLPLNKSKSKWLRPKEREKGLSEEEKTTAELYRNVVAILNKLTPLKFKTLVEKMMALNLDSSERLEDVIDIIFEHKAIGEPVFCLAYANMCRCLCLLKINDVDGNVVSFRKLLLNRCRKELEKEKEDEALLEKQKLEQLEGLSEEEQKAKKEELDEDLAKNKRRMLGNIKFMGELFKLMLLKENIMHRCIFKLLQAGDEESLESMCKLLFTIGKDLNSEKAKPRIVQYFDKINEIISAKKVSSRVIFMLRDVVDLRENKWVPRKEERYSEWKKGGLDSPIAVANDGWITTRNCEKSQPIDQNKLRNMTKAAVMIPGQRNQHYMTAPSITISQRPLRPGRTMYSSSPPKPLMMQECAMPRQYQVLQEPYGQIMRPGFIQNIPQPYPLPVSTASFPQQYISQTQPQQPQQRPAPNTGISTNTKKARSKRRSKIVIKDPNSNKYNTVSIIQAEFAAKVEKVEARRAGGKMTEQ